MDELDNPYLSERGMWNSSEQWSNTYEAETAYYAHLGNKNTLPTQAYDAWCAIAVHRRPVPHLKVVAGHAGKGKGGHINAGHLEAFRKMHGIPAGSLEFEYNQAHPVGVKEAFPGAWNPSEHRPPSNISGAEMTYYALVEKKTAPVRQAYEAWCAIAADQRPKPHIKVVAGHAKVQGRAYIKVGHLEDFRRAHRVPAGTLKFEYGSMHSHHPVAVEETSPGAWNRALLAMSSATADLPVTGYG
ncbi:hypothetical protein, partial [Streptomyces anthocyanicus]|uniref:hypothetical protein n=1 Tax=Streptomyces anthocyanicus TaxID=68174 RepID=UPI0036BA4491